MYKRNPGMGKIDRSFGKNGNEVISGGNKYTVTEIKPERPSSKVNGLGNNRSGSKKGIFDKGFG